VGEALSTPRFGRIGRAVLAGANSAARPGQEVSLMPSLVT
jgi:hypothetical protein